MPAAMMTPVKTRRRMATMLASLALQSAAVDSFQTTTTPAVVRCPVRLHASSGGDDDGGMQDTADASSSDGEPLTLISPASVTTVDDGGSDLTDRFKYKVHALMGTYDPLPGAVDDENQTGNIIGSLLQFPTEYTFSVVGKTGGDESAGDAYASDVKMALSSVLGSDVKMEIRVVPRGTKFTRVSAKVSVESASIIESIYEEFDALEATVMKF